MKQIFIVTILLVSLSQMLVSCKDTNIPISEGTQILFPEQLVFTQYASDTVAYTIPSDVPYKVVVYVISVPLKSGQININQTIPEKGKN